MAEQSFIASIPLQTNVSTANPNEAVKPIDAIATFRTANITESIAPPEILDHVTNTGQINESGVTNNYLMDANSTYDYTYVTEGGDTIGVVRSPSTYTNKISLNGRLIGDVSIYSIDYINGYDSYSDIIFTDTDPIGLVVKSSNGLAYGDIFNLNTGVAVWSDIFLGTSSTTSLTARLVQQKLTPSSPSFLPSSKQYIVCCSQSGSGASNTSIWFIGSDSGGTQFGTTVFTYQFMISEIWSCKFLTTNTNPVFYVLLPGGQASYNPLIVFSLTGSGPYYSVGSTSQYDVSWAIMGSDGISLSGYGITNSTPRCYVYADGSATVASHATYGSSGLSTVMPSSSGWGYCNLNGYSSGSPLKVYSMGIGSTNGDGIGGCMNGFGYFGKWNANEPVPRIGMVGSASYGETPQYISFFHAIEDSSYLFQAMPAGVPISPYGEIDILWGPRYVPTYNGASFVAWRYKGKHFIARCSSSIPTQIPIIQKISPTLYKINTITAVNIVDTSISSLTLGSIDYNGYGLTQYSSTPTSTWRCAKVLTGTSPSVNGSGIDNGGTTDVYTGTTSAQAPTFTPRNHWTPFLQTTKYFIGLYYGQSSSATMATAWTSFRSYPSVSGLYSDVANNFVQIGSSYVSDSSQIFAPTGTIWLGQQITGNSFAVYAPYKESFVTSGYVGSVITPNWDGYLIGNELPSQYQSFVIYGQAYLYDGKTIYSVTMSSNYVTTPLPVVCRAEGMTYLAASPTVAYFLSTFDNSIWYFDGARTLSKLRKFNQYPAIKSGVFNVRDNCLTLDADPYWIFVRDGFISITQKTPAQTGQAVRMFDTQNGTYLNIGTHFYQYGYSPSGITVPTGLPGSTAVQPIDFQTAYYGLGNNRITRNMRFYVTVYSSAKVKTSITVTVYSFNQDESKGKTSANPEIKVVNINPVDYDDGGYFRFSADPIHAKVLASSLRIQCNSKIAITEVMLKYDDSGMDAIYAPERRAR